MDEKTKTCSAAGCDRAARYPGAGLCQKHYFRLRRTGTTDDRPAPTRESRNAAGYVMVPERDHPLAMKNGRVYKHRKVVYDAGLFDGKCAMCGKPVTWKSCHVDHIDKDVGNNAVENLRVTCRPCNTFRDRAPAHTVSGRHAVTHNGMTMTPTEWARQDGVLVSRTCIVHRLKRGMSVESALYGKKITHVKKKS